MIAVKTEEEQEKMRAAGKIVGETLREIEKFIKPGISTMELNSIIESCIRDRGAIPSFKNYHGFPAAACISIDEVVVHGIPSLRVLKEGEIVSVDVGALIDGFHGDAARTFPVGKVSEQKLKLIEVTRECFFKGIERVKEGARLGDVSSAIQKHAESHGYGVVREMVGHGIGRKLHEPPDVPIYGVEGSGPVLMAGNCLAIEPMINMGTPRVIIDPNDGWTCRTRDLMPSAHYENTVIVGADGAEILTL